METKIVRKKLMTDFGKILEDDSKLELLESFFDAIIKDDKTFTVPESQYLMVEEARAKYFSDKNSGISWEYFENELNAKYGF